MKNDIALFYGKPTDKAVITPKAFIQHMKSLRKIGRFDFPRYCVISFFKKQCEYIDKRFRPKIIAYHDQYPIYIFRHKGIKIAFVYPLMGSYASSVVDEIVALGAKNIIFIGGAGVLKAKIPRGQIIVPSRAIRDEGVSFHYQKPSRYVYPSKSVVDAIKKTLREKNIPFLEGTTWTTDAPYRETKRKVQAFSKEGALSVEMEASAFFSVAKYWKANIGAIFIAGDCVTSKKWDPRRERKDITKIDEEREKLLEYALESLHKLQKL